MTIRFPSLLFARVECQLLASMVTVKVYLIGFFSKGFFFIKRLWNLNNAIILSTYYSLIKHNISIPYLNDLESNLIHDKAKLTM